MPRMPTPSDAPQPSAEELAAAQAAEDALQGEAVEDAKLAFNVDRDVRETIEELDEEMRNRVASLKAAYPLLTEEEILDALGDVKAEVLAKRKEAMIKRLMAEERTRLRREEGMTVGVSALDELVDKVIDCADWQNPIRMNFMEYHKGRSYPMPRHMANQIAEMEQWGRKLQRELDGKDSLSEFYKKQKAETFSPVKGRTQFGQAVAA